MIIAKIQSLLVVISFFTFLVIAGLCLGLMAVSAFSTGAEAMDSAFSTTTIAESHCGPTLCNLP